MAELIGGAVIGAVVGELLKAVLDAKQKASSFQLSLARLESTLNAITSRLDTINRLKFGIKEPEMKELEALITDGKALVLKCKNISTFNWVRKVQYAKQLLDFDDSLVRCYATDLPADMLGYMIETLARVNHEQLAPPTTASCSSGFSTGSGIASEKFEDHTQSGFPLEEGDFGDFGEEEIKEEASGDLPTSAIDPENFKYQSTGFPVERNGENDDTGDNTAFGDLRSSSRSRISGRTTEKPRLKQSGVAYHGFDEEDTGVLDEHVTSEISQVVRELLKAVLDAKQKASSFRPSLTRLETTINSITLPLDKINRLNCEFGIKESEMKELKALIRDGKALVLKCSKISTFNFLKKVQYSKELLDLDDSLLRYFQMVLPLDHFKATREILARVNELHMKLVDNTPPPTTASCSSGFGDLPTSGIAPEKFEDQDTGFPEEHYTGDITAFGDQQRRYGNRISGRTTQKPPRKKQLGLVAANYVFGEEDSGASDDLSTSGIPPERSSEDVELQMIYQQLEESETMHTTSFGEQQQRRSGSRISEDAGVLNDQPTSGIAPERLSKDMASEFPMDQPRESGIKDTTAFGEPRKSARSRISGKATEEARLKSSLGEVANYGFGGEDTEVLDDQPTSGIDPERWFQGTGNEFPKMRQGESETGDITASGERRRSSGSKITPGERTENRRLKLKWVLE